MSKQYTRADKRFSVEPRTSPRAEWLLSDWNDSSWSMAVTGDSQRTVNGVSRGVVTLDFSFILANGRSLLDPQYTSFLEDIRRTVFFSRAGVYSAGLQRADLQYQLLQDLFALANFMVNRGLDEPSTLLNFGSLTPHLFEEYCEIAATRGVAGIHGQDDNLAEFLSSVPTNEMRTVRQVSDATGIKMKTLLRSKRLNTQMSRSGVVAIPQRVRRTEFPSTRPTRFSTELPTVSRTESLINTWKQIRDCGPYLENPLTFDPFRYSSRDSAGQISVSRGAVPTQKTPSIPPDIGLYYLNRSIEWVVSYGDALVNYSNALDAELNRLMSKGTSRSDYYSKKAFLAIPVPDALKPLNICRYNSHSWSTPLTVRRAEFSVYDATRCLMAAAFVLFATFTARRRSELVYAPISSVVENWDGFDFTFSARKVSTNELLTQLTRPIPDLLAAAAAQISNLYATARAATLDEVAANRLFVLSRGYFREVTPMTHVVTKVLDDYADYIEVPLSKNGERWYLRPHECRRLFATAYFWHEEFQNLDALSWFLGHLTPEETRHYILDNQGRLPLDEVTAQRTLRALRERHVDVNLGSLDRLLYTRYGVKDITAVHDDDLEGYLSALIANDDLDARIVPSPELGSRQKLLILTSE